MISLCLTNFNRDTLLFQSFSKVLQDDRISEIIIVDDFSEYHFFSKVQKFCDEHAKIKLYRNTENLGMMRNKCKAISYATNEWCILFDSDNIIGPDYLDAIPPKLHSDTIYCPSFAKPQFDYTLLSNVMFNRQNVHHYINSSIFGTLLNTCNYLVHRENYLKVYEYDPKVKGSDTIHFNYLWLRNGGWFHVVEGMEYFHLVHSGSTFLQDVSYNMQMAEKTRQKIANLSK